MANVGKEERKTIQERRKQKQRQQRLMVIMIISGVAIIFFSLAFLTAQWDSLQPTGEIIVPEENPRQMADFNAQGDPDAPVTIVEYSDFQCPYCKRHAEETEPFIVLNHVDTGEVYLVRKSMGNFISDNIRRGKTESIDSAMAAYCAGDQGKFWEYKDILYANWLGEDAGSYTEKRLMAMAEALNLDMETFSSCFTENKYRELAEQDRIEGTQLGVTGTPAFIINGKLVSGAQPYSVFAQEIREALAAAGN
jgi:protein-disulfide isomerase